ncbi:MAG: nitroreductase/quinone reductase family protein [Candidatus Hodarchaeales archaeon]
MVSPTEEELNQPRSFPRPNTPYYGYIDDPDYSSNFLNLATKLNKIFIPLYRLRLYPILIQPFFHIMGEPTYMLTTKGRISGKKRRTVLAYHRINGVLHGASINPKKSQWYRNMITNPDDVWIQVNFRNFHAKIEILDDKETVELLKWFIKEFPSLSKFWGWDPEIDDVDTADFSPLLKIYKFFRIHRYKEDTKVKNQA